MTPLQHAVMVQNEGFKARQELVASWVDGNPTDAGLIAFRAISRVLEQHAVMLNKMMEKNNAER